MRNAPRQTLVLTDEQARHPFLARLPEHVRRERARFDPRPFWHVTKDDVRGFASAYVACTLAILVFLL
ncbi:hypothetical protein [Altererythrobacter sp. MF3-039]|uniref:hypothetical protein n=1 Tax=Altererythrobacter sp. MF3-039 TaxID=3252901 RepID=UPI00390C4E53